MELLTHAVKGRTIVVAPIGDIQWSGTKGATALDHLRAHIDEAMARDAWFLGMGDYIDFMSPSNRAKLRGAGLYNTAEDVIDSKATELVHELYDLALRPTKGRWLGLLEGHHYSALKAGDTSDMRLCQLLDAPFLGTTACVRLAFKPYPSSERRVSAVIWAHHGARGTGMYEGSALNELQQTAAAWEGVDVYVMGHVPKGPVAPLNKPYVRWDGTGGPDVIHKTAYLVRAGGFSKAYVVGAKEGQVPRGEYAEQKAYKPGYIGAPFITFQVGTRRNRDELLIRVEI